MNAITYLPVRDPLLQLLNRRRVLRLASLLVDHVRNALCCFDAENKLAVIRVRATVGAFEQLLEQERVSANALDRFDEERWQLVARFHYTNRLLKRISR